MASIYKSVHPEDFDAAKLLKLAEEGRLFFTPIVRSTEKEQVANSLHILEYVGALRACADEPYKDNIDFIWQEIVKNDALQKRLSIQKGTNAGCMNKYFITAIVDVLSNIGVYRDNTIQLHRIMENITTRNKYYNSMGLYVLSSNERQIIRELAKKYRNIPRV